MYIKNKITGQLVADKAGLPDQYESAEAAQNGLALHAEVISQEEADRIYEIISDKSMEDELISSFAWGQKEIQ